MMHNTAKRVAINTDREINRAIYEDTLARVELFAHGDPAEIDIRLREIDREWNIERLLETNASLAVLVGLWLGTTVDRRLLILPALVGGFLLQHAIQGWCPPLPLLRRLGVRTEREIEYERNALKALRGDFASLENIPQYHVGRHAERSLQAAVR